MPKFKAVIRELPSGTKYDVYKRKFFWWQWEMGFRPLTLCLYLIDENVQRLKELYGEENVIVDDRRKKQQLQPK